MADRNTSPSELHAAKPNQIDWEAALTIHRDWLRTVVLARTREPQSVDEVMQEVAVAAVKSPSPPADENKIAPWLYQLAVRQSLMHRRRQGRRRRLVDRYAQRLSPAMSDGQFRDPLAWLLADEREMLVRVALGGLTPPDAEILLLKYTEDWSYRKLAEHLGISQSAVEARLHRARQRLRQKLTRLEVIDAK